MAKQTSLTGMAYRQLREELLTCRLSPGSPLNIKKLSERFEVSLGAIREALSRLISEGFVLAEGRGFRAAPISVDDLHDLTNVRIDIESQCLRRSIAAGGLEWETNIVAALHRLSKTPMRDVADSSRLNESYASSHAMFHAALVAGCDSQWLLRLRDLLYAQSERYRYLAVPLAKEERDVVGEHSEMVKAALARDERRAVELLEKHLRKTTTQLLAKAKMAATAVDARDLAAPAEGTSASGPIILQKVPGMAEAPRKSRRPPARSAPRRSRTL